MYLCICSGFDGPSRLRSPAAVGAMPNIYSIVTSSMYSDYILLYYK